MLHHLEKIVDVSKNDKEIIDYFLYISGAIMSSVVDENKVGF